MKFSSKELELLRSIFEENGIVLGGKSKKLEVELPDGEVSVLDDNFNIFDDIEYESESIFAGYSANIVGQKFYSGSIIIKENLSVPVEFNKKDEIAVNYVESEIEIDYNLENTYNVVNQYSETIKEIEYFKCCA